MSIEWKLYKYKSTHPIYKKVAIFYSLKNPAKLVYEAILTGKNSQNTKFFETAREAALCVDKYLLNHGKPAINILKPKIS